MKVRIGEGATEEEASAVAAALAEHLAADIEVHVGDAEEPAATAEPPEVAYPLDDELGPTEREAQLHAEIEEILGGGPEKYKERLSEQGKLFVRDRLDLWFGEGGDGGPGDADREGAADGVRFEATRAVAAGGRRCRGKRRGEHVSPCPQHADATTVTALVTTAIREPLTEHHLPSRL